MIQQPQQPQAGNKKTFGLILLLFGALLSAFGLCSIWVLGLGIIPLIFGVPMFFIGLVMML